MEILFVSPVPTDPCDAGNRARISTLTKAVQGLGHHVHFAYIPLEDADLDAMRIRFGVDYFHPLPWTIQKENSITALTRKFGRFFNLSHAFNYRLDSWFDSNANLELEKLHKLHQFDAVVVEYVFMSKCFEAFPKEVLKILDTHDRFGLRYKHYLDAGMRPRWFSTSLEEEEEGFCRADVVMAIQDIEAKEFSKRVENSSTNVIQVGHLIDIPEAICRSSKHEAVVFVGSDNPINTAGAEYFISKVLPLLRHRKPEFEMIVAGSVSKDIKPQPGVVNLGFVEKLQDAFDSAMIAINPVLAGTGINIKLLDAMAAGMPIITTATGARGLENFDGKAFLSVEDQNPEEFCNQIIQLLDNKEFRQNLESGARDAAHSWNTSQIESLSSILNKISKSELEF